MFVQIDGYFVNVERITYIRPYAFASFGEGDEARKGIIIHFGESTTEDYEFSLEGEQSERFLAALDRKAQIYKA